MLLEGQLFGIVMRVDSDTIPYVHGDLSNTPRCAESPRRYEWRNVFAYFFRLYSFLSPFLILCLIFSVVF